MFPASAVLSSDNIRTGDTIPLHCMNNGFCKQFSADGNRYLRRTADSRRCTDISFCCFHRDPYGRGKQCFPDTAYSLRYGKRRIFSLQRCPFSCQISQCFFDSYKITGFILRCNHQYNVILICKFTFNLMFAQIHSCLCTAHSQVCAVHKKLAWFFPLYMYTGCFQFFLQFFNLYTGFCKPLPVCAGKIGIA